MIEIDHEARTATLQTADGATTPIQVGPEAVNFPQVQKGDMVKAIVAEELLIAMIPAGMAASSAIEAGAAAAPEGAMPGGIVASSVRLVATVVAIDAEARTATLQFEDGSQKTVPVRADIDLTKHNPGEKVLFQITEMVAVSVEKK